VATTVSAVLSVVSTCFDTDSARLAVTSLALRRLVSRACHICQVSMPTTAAERQSANATVRFNQDPRASRDGIGDGAGNAEDSSNLMTRDAMRKRPRSD
jgi:hypothetical protein